MNTTGSPLKSSSPSPSMRQRGTKNWKRWILGISLSAALVSFGCPQKNDPLEAFNQPNKTVNPNNPNDNGPDPVPEPATALLFGAALLIGGRFLKRKQGGHLPH